jgi:xanthosine utilization system XapX-like protein
MSPTDVADRVSAYVRDVPVEESHQALRRAALRMPQEDLQQLAMAFGLAPTTDRVLLLAHFLTVPEEFKPHLARFLHRHPRALAFFDDADVRRIFGVAPKRKRSQRLYVARSPVFVATISSLVVLTGLAFGVWLAMLGHRYAAPPVTVAVLTPHRPPTSKPLHTPAPATPAPATPVPAAHTSVGSWRIEEANVVVGPIVWAGSGAISRGNTMELVLHKESVDGRRATSCEEQTELHAALAIGNKSQTVPYRERNCEGITSTGQVHVLGFVNAPSFHGSFWQGSMKLGDFNATKTNE